MGYQAGDSVINTSRKRVCRTTSPAGGIVSKIDPRVLKEFATTDRHHQVLDAVIELGSANKASKKLKCGRRGIDVMLKRL